jgi:ATP-dependent DNA ligase
MANSARSTRKGVTGFDQAALKSLYGTMQPLRSDKKPFDQKVKSENATTWLIPKLVGEVKFTEWTSESEMRHPVFLGLAPTNGRSTPSANKLERNFDETGARWQFVAFTHTLTYIDKFLSETTGVEN